MPSALVSIVGTTTSVRRCGGNPREKSMRGKGRGATVRVAIQFTMPITSWLVASARMKASAAASWMPAPSCIARMTNAAVSAAVHSAIAPR